MNILSEIPIYTLIPPMITPFPLYTYEIPSRPAAEPVAAPANCTAGVHAWRFDMHRWVTVHIKGAHMDPCRALWRALLGHRANQMVLDPQGPT